jgi:hypothetical protein
MQDEVTGGVDWDVLAGKSAKHVAVFAGLVVGLLAVPAFNADGGPRLAVAIALGVAAIIAFLTGRSLMRPGKDATEGAARTVTGLLMAAAALWFSNLVPAPPSIQSPTVSQRLGEVIQTVGGAPPKAMDTRLNWSISGEAGAAQRLLAPMEDALAKQASMRPISENARHVSAGMAIAARAGSLAGGQITATARVALAAENAPVCRFNVSTARPMPMAVAVERLSQQVLDRTQAYIEGSDTC